jgi:hypothetical protein
MYKIVDAEGKVYGVEEDYGNAAELWMVLEEFKGITLYIVEANTDV